MATGNFINRGRYIMPRELIVDCDTQRELTAKRITMDVLRKIAAADTVDREDSPCFLHEMNPMIGPPEIADVRGPFTGRESAELHRHILLDFIDQLLMEIKDLNDDLATERVT
jgi:hypothetical protein